MGRITRTASWIVVAALVAGVANGRAQDGVPRPGVREADHALPQPRRTAVVPRARIGDRIDQLRFTDIRYLTRSMADLGEKQAFVFVFTNTTCPIVAKYWPKLKQLDAEFRDRGVQLVSINAGPDEEIQAIAQQGIDFGIEFPLVKDADGQCVERLGVERTPEVVVLDAERRLRYRGRIDDQIRLGGSRPDVTRDDLRSAIEAVLDGREIAEPETPVDGCRITPYAVRLPDFPVTFHEHVSPLFARHCQECHRPNGPAPFSLVTFDDVAGQAAMIDEVVSQRRMPPWHANRRHSFVNERGLSSAERQLVAGWIAGGLREGDAAKAVPPRTFSDSKWEIGEPDLIVTALETHSLPERGFVDYKYVVLPQLFLRDTWITAAEIMPSNPRVVHHANMAYWTVGKSFDDGNFITGRVPGGTAMTLRDGMAFRIPQGSVVGLQIHYTTSGKPETNRMSVGFRFPRETIHKQLHHEQVTTSRFEIPPGAAAHRVSASRVLPCNASGVGMFAHMHLRGKDMTFIAHPPSTSNASPETLMSIPNYHYDWQQNYRWAPDTRKFPKGTRIEAVAHFDNSPFNPFNPDPATTVRHGPQTVQEMMFGFFFYTDDDEELNLTVDPRTGHATTKTGGGS